MFKLIVVSILIFMCVGCADPTVKEPSYTSQQWEALLTLLEMETHKLNEKRKIVRSLSEQLEILHKTSKERIKTLHRISKNLDILIERLRHERLNQ